MSTVFGQQVYMEGYSQCLIFRDLFLIFVDKLRYGWLYACNCWCREMDNTPLLFTTIGVSFSLVCECDAVGMDRGTRFHFQLLKVYKGVQSCGTKDWYAWSLKVD